MSRIIGVRYRMVAFSCKSLPVWKVGLCSRIFCVDNSIIDIDNVNIGRKSPGLKA